VTFPAAPTDPLTPTHLFLPVLLAIHQSRALVGLARRRPPPGSLSGCALCGPLRPSTPLQPLPCAPKMHQAVGLALPPTNTRATEALCPHPDAFLAEDGCTTPESPSCFSGRARHPCLYTDFWRDISGYRGRSCSVPHGAVALLSFKLIHKLENVSSCHSELQLLFRKGFLAHFHHHASATLLLRRSVCLYRAFFFQCNASIILC
jgi:hypothetical protein